MSVAEHIHSPCRLEHHQTHSFNFDTDRRDLFQVAAKPDERPTKRFPADATFNHQLEGHFGGANRAHAVVDAARAKAQLRDLEPATLAQQDVVLWYADVGETNVHMPVRGVVFTEDLHAADDLNAGSVHRDQDL